MIKIVLLVMAFNMLLVAGEVLVLPADLAVDPFSGELIGENPLPPGGLAALNLADDHRISLDASPGETVALQILLEQHGATLQLAGDGADWCRLYQVGLVRAAKEGRHLPDLLMPLADDGGMALRGDGPLFPTDARYAALWLDIAVPANRGKGTVKVALRQAGERSPLLEIRLQIRGAALPAPSVFIDLNDYGDKYLRPWGKGTSPAERMTAERDLFRMARADHAVVNPLPYLSQEGHPRRGMVPELLGDDPLAARFDWRAFDERFGPYLDGSAFEDRHPLRHFYLPFNPNWPAPFELYSSDRTRYEQIWARTADAYLTHFKEKGWTKTVFHVYCNQKPNKNNGIPWNLDEPKGVADYTALRYYSDLTRRVFANAAPVDVRFRVDISHFYCDEHRGEENKDFRVNGGDRILEPTEIWFISEHSLTGYAARRAARQLRQQGREVWIYGATPRIDKRGPAALESIYLAWDDSLNGVMIWRTFTDETDNGNGSKFICYALAIDGARGIYPSLRLKRMRRAIDDTRLIEQALSDGHITPAQLGRFLDIYHNGNPADYVKLRKYGLIKYIMDE